jgi:hypothetical protein
MDYVELYVGNALQSAHYFQNAFGFQPLAMAGLETGLTDRESYVVVFRIKYGLFLHRRYMEELPSVRTLTGMVMGCMLSLYGLMTLRVRIMKLYCAGPVPI